jgi:hypothetical protein
MKSAMFIFEDLENKESIVNALTDLQDEDLNGNNGEKYLWVDTINAECETNLDYLVKVCMESDTTDVEKLASLYCRTWINHDGYYTDFDVICGSFGNGEDYKGKAVTVLLFTDNDKVDVE